MITHAYLHRHYATYPAEPLCDTVKPGDLKACVTDVWENHLKVNCPECRRELDRIAANRRAIDSRSVA